MGMLFAFAILTMMVAWISFVSVRCAYQKPAAVSLSLKSESLPR